jgi:hypothetical protein
MADEPENITLVMLRDIRAKQDEHSRILMDHTHRFERLDKRFEDLSKLLRYSMG